ncbi:unnamed protein product [Lactuca virosa]|uniref:Uncharacterized protein n=1 Tax=Lactuca virosa TaxID=75947 RepID=A0AAU9MT12_9ASTR|nr:unnamed protein product [Lactuca virosa]
MKDLDKDDREETRRKLVAMTFVIGSVLVLTNISVVYTFHYTHQTSPPMPSKQPALSPSCITQFETDEILKMGSNQPPATVVLQPYVLLGKHINVVDRQIHSRLPRPLSEEIFVQFFDQWWRTCFGWI